MRAVIISFISISIIIVGWGIFVNYADKNIHELKNMIEEELIVSVYEEDWDSAKVQLKDLSERWHQQKKIYSFFFDTRAVMETDYSIARAKNYIYAEDIPLSSGELSCVNEQLGFLHLNELITLDNVF